MQDIEPRQMSAADHRATAEYLFDMIAQLARLARQIGDLHAAIHLEAIIAARRATARDLSAA